MDVVELQHDLARRRRRLVDAQEDLAPHHQAREPLLRRALSGNRVDRPPTSKDGDAICDLEHLVQLVADEDDRHALALEISQDGEELACLLRCEYGRWLVENQDVGPAVQRLQDLNALLLAD